MSDSPLPSRPEKRWLVPGALVLLCAGHVALGLGLLPGWMFAKYPDSARLLTEGRLSGEQSADFSPLYLLLNLVLAPGTLRVVQSLAGAVGLVAVYTLGARLVSRAAGLLGALLMALAVPLLVCEATLEPDLLVTVLNVAGLALLADARPRFDLPRLLGAGVLMGLSSATRPTSLLVLGFGALWVARELWASPRRRFAVPALLLLVGVLASVLPPMAVRARAGSQLGATMSAGGVMHMGNRPEGTGMGAQPPTLLKQYEAQLRSAERPDYAHHLYREFARAEAGHALSASEAELFWMGKTVRFAWEEPGTFLGLLGRKLAFFFCGPEGHDIVEMRRADVRLSAMPLLSAQVLGLLGLAGLAVALARRERVGLVLLYIAANLAVALGFYVLSRYRFPTLPAWALLGGVLAAAAFEERRRPRRLAVVAGALAVSFCLPALFPFIRDVQQQMDRGDAGAADGAALNAALRAGRYDEATRAFERLQAAHPFTALLRNLRGVPFESPEVAAHSAAGALERFGADTPLDLFFAAELSRRAGHCELALPAARASADAGFRGFLYDNSLDPTLVAASCLLSQGNRAGALEEAAHSLERRGGTLDGLAFAVAGAEALPEQAGARRAAWESKLFALHDMLSARHARGSARLRWGNAAGALEDAEAVLAVVPDLAVTEYLRATALAALGRNAEAVQSYGRALRRVPGFTFPTAPLDAAVSARLAEAPDSPGVLALAAEHHLRAGRLELARELARRASQAAPNDAGLATLVRNLSAAQPSGIGVPPPPAAVAAPDAP